MSGFRTGICSCMMDKGSCCDVIFCPCCQFGRQCNAIEGHVSNMNCMWCILPLICGLAPFMPMCIRCKVSDKYQLGEFCLMSMCCGYVCSACSLCQTHRELNLQGVNPGGTMCTPVQADQMMT